MVAAGQSPLKTLCEAAIILTPNKRLAGWLVEQFASLLPSGGGTLCPPRVMPFESFIDQLASNAVLAGALPAARLLDNVEELMLWQRIIDADPVPGLLSSWQVAVECQRAATRIAEWQVELDHYRFEIGSDADGAMFLRWYGAMHRALVASGATTRWQLVEQLLALPAERYELLWHCLRNPVANPDAAGSEQLQLYGFTALSPAQRGLVEAMQRGAACTRKPALDEALFDTVIDCANPDAMNAKLHRDADSGSYRLQRQPAEIFKRRCSDAEQELRAAAQWACRLHRDNPRQRIAVVLPGLNAARERAQRVFSDVFAAAQSADMQSGDAFELSAGQPLLQVPLVRDFIALCEATLQRLPRSRWRALLHSPFLWPRAFALRERRATLAAIERSGEAAFRLDELAALLAWSVPRMRSGQAAAVSARKVLGGLARRIAGAGSAGFFSARDQRGALLSEWIRRMFALLEAAGWPGQRSLDSIEYQQYSAMLRWRDGAAQLDSLLGSVRAPAALRCVRQQLAGLVFHAETRRAAGSIPVQVLGVLEAQGQLYDHLWVCGLSDREWPLQAGKAALLPASMQAVLGMPGASAEREMDYAERSTAALLECAQQLVLSFSDREESIACEMSPLVIAALCDRRLADYPAENTQLQATAALPGVTLEQLPEVNGSPLPFTHSRDDSAPALQRASVAMLADHKLDPLFAYCRHRLAIAAAEQLNRGLGARDRGILLHSVLHEFWHTLGTRDALRALDVQQRSLLLEKLIDEAAGKLQQQRFRPVPALLLALQLEILRRQIEDWLALEQQRPDFHVAELETALNYRHGTIELYGIADRIDRLQDGSLLLIDYKTGHTALGGWFDESLSQPQLPAYALALQQREAGAGSESRLAAVAFAVINASERTLRGVAAGGSAAAAHGALLDPATRKRGPDVDFDELLLRWRLAVEAGLSELQQGCVAVPVNARKRGQGTQQLQQFAPLLRDFARGDPPGGSS